MAEQVWGIDPSSTKGVAVGIWPARRALTIGWDKATGPERLRVAYDEIRCKAVKLARLYPPTLVVVEQPAGKYVKPSLVKMVGITELAIYDGLRDVFAHPVSVLPVGVGEWKKQATGRGDATKDDVMRWAVSEGCAARSQDEADALAVACAGYRMLQAGRDRGASAAAA